MSENQVLVSLQMDSGNIRLLAGEFYSDRLNVIAKVETTTSGMDGIVINDKAAVTESLKKAVEELSALISTPVVAVLLCIPTYRFSMTMINSYQLVKNAEHKISYEEVKNIYHEGNNYNVGNNREVINTVCTSYKADHIEYQKMPIGKTSDYLEAQVQLLCSDRDITYAYLEVLNDAGLKVIDISLDSLAIAKEAAFFEQSANNYILNVNLEGDHTVFTLIAQGQIINSAAIMEGYNPVIKAIMKQYLISYEKAYSLLERYVTLDEVSDSSRIITRYTDNRNQSKVITFGDLSKCIQQPLHQFADNLKNCCNSIIALNNLKVVITGQGAHFDGFDRLLEKEFNRQTTAYYPETLGARDCQWVANLGMLYAYKDNDQVYQNHDNSINMNEYLNNLMTNVKNTGDGDDVTSRIKSITEKIFKSHIDDQEGK